MNYCTNCGNKLEENSSVCIHCGVKLKEENNVVNIEDKGGFGWGLLGFFIPLVGLILYLVWKDEKPKTAKSAGKGALTYLIVYIVLIVIMFIIGFIGGFTGDIVGEYIEENYNNYDDYYYDFD